MKSLHHQQVIGIQSYIHVMEQNSEKKEFLQLAESSKSLEELELKVRKRGMGDSVIAEHPKLTRKINVRTVIRAASESRNLNNKHFEEEYGFLGRELMGQIRRLV